MSADCIPTLTLSCLGGLDLSLRDSAKVPIPPKAGELLVVLVLARGEPLSREAIAQRLWPKSHLSAGLISLRSCLKRLRRALEPHQSLIESDNRFLHLKSEAVDADAPRFEEAIRKANRTRSADDFESALAIYQGRLLPKSMAPAIQTHRKRLHGLYLKGVEDCAECLVVIEQRERAIRCLRSALETDPTRGNLVGFLLRLLERDAAAAERVFKKYSNAVKLQAGGVDERIAEQMRQIRRMRVKPDPRANSDPAEDGSALSPRIERIPRPLHPFIGRADDLARIRAKLDQRPFVTLLGMGGVGKTRLAVEIGLRCGPNYRDGAAFIDLSGLPPGTSADEISKAIASALEIPDGSAPATQRTTAFLERRHLLLILDNADHVPVACMALARDLLQRCPLLSLLVTSRVDLEAGFGVTIRIKPLGLPTGAARLEDLKASAAVQLFMAAVEDRRDNFQLTEENAAAIESICRATDGLPLVIYLVAAANFFTLEELARQLRGGFASIELAEEIASPPSAKTALGSVAWSYALLSPVQREFFCCLALFSDGWSREAAAAVYARSGQKGVSATSLLNQLQSRSLIERRDVGARSRYFMYETVREYAGILLAKSGSYSRMAQAHLDFYLELAEALNREEQGDALLDTLDAVSNEQQNLRTALEYALESGQIEMAVRLASANSRLWYAKGRHRDGQAWMEKVLAISETASAAVRRLALHAAAKIAYMRHDFEQADRLWNHCLAISVSMGNTPGILSARMNLGNTAMARLDLPSARDHFQTCLDAYRLQGDSLPIAQALSNLAMAVSAAREYDYARALYAESLSLLRPLENLPHTILALNNLADTLIALGEHGEAHDALAEAVELNLKLENPRSLAHCLTNYVMLAVTECAWPRAAFLFGAHEALRTTIECPLPFKAQFDYQSGRRKTAAALGDETFEIYRSAGAQTGIPEVCRIVRDRDFRLA